MNLQRLALAPIGALVIGVLAIGGCTSKGTSDGGFELLGFSFAGKQRELVIDPNNLPMQQTVEQMAARWRAQYNIPGVWCAVIRDGKVVAFVASGVKSTATNAPASVDDKLPIASLSKPITGSMIASFVASGKISYDTKFREVFPELASQYPNSPVLNATLKQFLSHTSGVPKEGFPGMLNTTVYGNVPLMLQRSLSSIPNLKAPGSIREYSNLNYCLAAAMVERATGTKASDWLRSETGRGVGLVNAQDLSQGHDVTLHTISGSTVTPINARPKWSFNPAGGYVMTLEDLCAFATFTMEVSERYPSPVATAMLSRVAPISQTTAAGWQMGNSGYYAHNGALTGLYASILIDPQRNNAVIWVTNSNMAQGPHLGRSMPQLTAEADSLIRARL
jgi:CubicO group peptidase (beta-lactamase class C family)